MVKAAFRYQITKTMVDLGLDTHKYLKKVGLPLEEPDDPETLIPVKPLYRLVHRVAHEENIPDFGSKIIQLHPWSKVETLGPLLESYPSLSEFLDKFCPAASMQSTLADFHFSEGQAENWFSYHGEKVQGDNVQMDMYRITGMIQIVQLATGSGWRPLKVELRSPKIDLSKFCDLISQSDVSFSRTQLKLGLQKFELNLPVRLVTPTTPVKYPKNHDLHVNFLDTLTSIMLPYLARGDCNLRNISQVTELSTRTLQRRLRSHGECFSSFLEKERLKISQEYLMEPSISVLEISRMLGYSDSANFTRAFRRWTGQSPREYRLSLKQE